MLKRFLKAAPETSEPPAGIPPKLVFHVGDPKTGSSSIQRVLFDRTWSLPGQAPDKIMAYPETLNAIPMAKALYEDAPPKRRKTHWGEAADWLASQKAPAAIFSAEHFAFVRPQVLKQAIELHLPDHDRALKIVAYVRPHISRLVSTYAQRVKSRGLSQDFVTFCRQSVEQNRFDYAPRFTDWLDTFGDAFILRPMIRDRLAQGDVVADFIGTVLDSDAVSVDTSGQVNESPTLDQLACLLLLQGDLQAAGVEQSTRHALCSSLAQRLARRLGGGGERLRMPRDLLEDMRTTYAGDAAALDATFFDGTPMSDALTADIPVAETPQSLAAEDRFDALCRKRLHRTAQRLAEGLKADPTGWKRHYRQERRKKDAPHIATAPAVAEIDTLLDYVCDIFA